MKIDRYIIFWFAWRADKQTPVRLQLLARAVVRTAMRGGVLRRHPELREAPRAPPPAACPRRICIPIEPGGAVGEYHSPRAAHTHNSV